MIAVYGEKDDDDASQLYREGEEEYPFQAIEHIADFSGISQVFQQQFVFITCPAFKKIAEITGDGHDANPSDLNQRSNDKLPERRKERAGIHYDQARNTNRTRGGKEGIE